MKYSSIIITLLAATSLLFAGCNKEQETTTTGSAKVSVHVSDFTISMTDIQSKDGTNPADYGGVGALTLAFFDGQTEVFRATQIKSDNTTYTVFGDFECELPIGNYTMVALGYYYVAGDVFVLNSPTNAAFTSERPRETFAGTQSVTVTNTTPLDLSMTLHRIVARLRIVSTDGRSASATKLRTTYSKCSKSFNPTTGLALDDNGFSQVNTPSTAAGATISVASFPFLFTDEETVNITIEVLDDEENVLCTKVVSNVPLKRNRETTLTGAVYSTDASNAGFQLETDWLEGNVVNF